MTTQSNDQGRAYEYIWINALKKELEPIRPTRIEENSSLEANRKAWNAMADETKAAFSQSANSAVYAVIELEPLLTEESSDELILAFQKDDAGTLGDVRDIVIKRDEIGWEIGLSIKHNHEAIKHSRLSHRLDFGEEWFGAPCSAQYWNDIEPIFSRLKIEKDKGTEWSEIPDKETYIYIPLLQAFINEVNRACARDATIPQKMVEYLIGKCDYYKVVSFDKRQVTSIYTFNIHGTLNKPSMDKTSSITVPHVDLPTEMVALKFKTGSNNTVEMYLNNGWELSFRIHNASTKVEPSLKFDVQFIGMPPSILTIECKWTQH